MTFHFKIDNKIIYTFILKLIILLFNFKIYNVDNLDNIDNIDN